MMSKVARRLEGRDILSMKDLSREEVELIFRLATHLELTVVNRRQLQVLKEKILASLFFQASTRTRLSFESAMHRLGGSVVGFADASASRAGDVYGETIEDTARMIQSYSDVVAIRHPEVGVPRKFAEYCSVPVINGGDGYGDQAEHPTQALLDLFTILKQRKRIDGLHIVLWGDMNQRTMQSLAYGLTKFNNVKVSVYCPTNLRFPRKTEAELRQTGLDLQYVSFDDEASSADVIYVLGPKKARSELPTENEFRLTHTRVRKAKRDLIILHPFPRLDEIGQDIDGTSYAKYFEQPLHGVSIRMSLLALVLGKSSGI